jgi:hypothetical protein
MKLRGLVPISYIHVSVSNLYIFPVPEFIDPVIAKTSPKRGFPMTKNEGFRENWVYKFGQQNRQTDPGYMYIAHRCVNVEIGRQNIIILFWK